MSNSKSLIDDLNDHDIERRKALGASIQKHYGGEPPFTTPQLKGESRYETKEIDQIIYSEPARSMDREGWINLSLAALDQAGLKSPERRKIRRMIWDLILTCGHPNGFRLKYEEPE